VSRQRVLEALLVLLALAAAASLLWPPTPFAPVSERQSRQAVPRTPMAPPTGEARELHRNIFQYGATPTQAPARTTAVSTAVPTAAPTAPPVKLIGVVRRSDGLRAALAAGGEIILAETGQKVAGYSVISIDENDGVILTGPDDQQIRLRPAER
jgi:hypothetical protein